MTGLALDRAGQMPHLARLLTVVPVCAVIPTVICRLANARFIISPRVFVSATMREALNGNRRVSGRVQSGLW